MSAITVGLSIRGFSHAHPSLEAPQRMALSVVSALKRGIRGLGTSTELSPQLCGVMQSEPQTLEEVLLGWLPVGNEGAGEAWGGSPVNDKVSQ